MIVRTLMIWVVLSLISIPGYAEYYKYRDTNGILRFTDNLLDIPKEQRENIEAYKEVVTPEPAPEASDVPKDNTVLKSRIIRIEQLNSERQLLEQSFKDLEAERNTLSASSPDPQDVEAYEDHRKRIETFNEKIKSYEAQRKLFQAKVDAFNAEMESQ